MSPRHTKKSRIHNPGCKYTKIFSLFVRHLSTIGRDRRYVDRLCLLVQRLHREQEGRSFALALGLEPKLSSMKLHEVLAKHQSQTGTFLVLSVP